MKSKKTNAKRQVVSHTVQPVVRTEIEDMKEMIAALFNRQIDDHESIDILLKAVDCWMDRLTYVAKRLKKLEARCAKSK